MARRATPMNETGVSLGRWSEVGIPQWCHEPVRKSDPEPNEHPRLSRASPYGDVEHES